jgi:hypothetical protein
MIYAEDATAPMITDAPKRRGRPRKNPVAVEETPAPVVFDLDAVVAELHDKEALEPFKFVYKAKTWTIEGNPTDRDIRMFGERGLDDITSLALTFRAMLGEEQWAEFPAIGMPAILEIYTAYARHYKDLALGE